MNLRYIIIVLCILYPTLSFSQWDIKKAFESGVNALENHDYMTSIQFLTKVIDARSNHHKALFFRGKAKYQLGDFAGCESDETQAILLNPYYYDAYELRGFSREKTKKFHLAAEDFSIACANMSNRSDLSEHQILCELKSGNYLIADSLVSILLRCYPDKSDLFVLKAKAKFGLCDLASSETYIDQAIETEHYHHEALTIKANFLMRAHKWKEAVAYYTRALYINPKDPTSLMNRAICKGISGEIENAKTDLYLLMDISPGNPIGRKALSLNSPNDFNVLVDSVISQDSFIISQLLTANTTYVSSRELAKDYEFISPQYLSDYKDEAYNLDNQFKEAYQNLLNHNYSEAINIFSKIIQANNIIPEAFYNRAYAYIRENNFSQANEDLSKAISLRENYSEAHYNRGLVKLILNDPHGASVDFSLAGQYGISYAYKLIERINNNYF